MTLHHTTKILFVCTGNQYRSPLAAAFFRWKLQQDGFSETWVVSSAGTWANPGTPVPTEVKSFARRMGLDLEDHVASRVTESLLNTQDVILVMEVGHREALRFEFPEMSDRIFLLSEVVDRVVYNIPDPLQDGRPYATVAMELLVLIDRGYSEILRLGDNECTATA